MNDFDKTLVLAFYKALEFFSKNKIKFWQKKLSKGDVA